MAKLPLPDEQPIAVSALRTMRAKIAGEIAMHTREIDRLRTELIHLIEKVSGSSEFALLGALLVAGGAFLLWFALPLIARRRSG